MERLKKFLEALWSAVKKHPAVVVIALCCGVVAGLMLNTRAEPWCRMVIVSPFCVMAALIPDRYARGWAKWALNGVIVALFVLAAAIPGIEDWPEKVPYMVLSAAVVPLTYISYKPERGDVPFCTRVGASVWSAVIAGLVGTLVCLLLLGLYEAFFFLFPGLHQPQHLEEILSCLGLVSVSALVFIALEDGPKQYGENSFPARLSQWVITPAFAVYTLFLAAYAVKICVQWSLPRGGVAGMCLGWCVAAAYVSVAYRSGWLTHWKWLPALRPVAVLPLTLMWIAVFRRIHDYGLTTDRYFLMLCAAVATVFFILLMVRGNHRYFAAVAAAWVAFLCSVMVPGVKWDDAVEHFRKEVVQQDGKAPAVAESQNTALQ